MRRGENLGEGSVKRTQPAAAGFQDGGTGLPEARKGKEAASPPIAYRSEHSPTHTLILAR